MMNDFKIVTDSTADLPESYYKEHNVGVLHLSCLLDGEVYGAKNPIVAQTVYDRIRQGSMPTTSQVNPEEAKEGLLEFLKESKNILYIAFSSGLSGTFQSVKIAAEEIMEEDDSVKIVVIDSFAAALGEGLLVYKAVEMKEKGASFDETCIWTEKHRLNIVHVFTVDDLNHLFRGGRVSRAAAVIGTVVGIKPLLHVDNDGHLINIGKARGRKKSLLNIIDMLGERAGGLKDPKEPVFIGHGDCLEDAEFCADEIRKRYGTETILIDYVGPVIGCHTGPGVVAIFTLGEYR